MGRFGAWPASRGEVGYQLGALLGEGVNRVLGNYQQKDFASELGAFQDAAAQEAIRLDPYDYEAKLAQLYANRGMQPDATYNALMRAKTGKYAETKAERDRSARRAWLESMMQKRAVPELPTPGAAPVVLVGEDRYASPLRGPGGTLSMAQEFAPRYNAAATEAESATEANARNAKWRGVMQNLPPEFADEFGKAYMQDLLRKPEKVGAHVVDGKLVDDLGNVLYEGADSVQDKTEMSNGWALLMKSGRRVFIPYPEGATPKTPDRAFNLTEAYIEANEKPIGLRTQRDIDIINAWNQAHPGREQKPLVHPRLQELIRREEDGTLTKDEKAELKAYRETRPARFDLGEFLAPATGEEAPAPGFWGWLFGGGSKTSEAPPEPGPAPQPTPTTTPPAPAGATSTSQKSQVPMKQAHGPTPSAPPGPGAKAKPVQRGGTVPSGFAQQLGVPQGGGKGPAEIPPEPSFTPSEKAYASARLAQYLQAGWDVAMAKVPIANEVRARRLKGIQ